MTQTPKCSKCADTGFVPPFMDACPCGATAPLHNEVTIVGEVAFGPVPTTYTPVVPGTSIPTPGFPADPTVGQKWTRHAGDAGTYVFDGSVWLAVPTEELTPAEYHAKYPSPTWSGSAWSDGSVWPDAAIAESVEIAAADIEREADEAATAAFKALCEEFAAEEEASVSPVSLGWLAPDGTIEPVDPSTWEPVRVASDELEAHLVAEEKAALVPLDLTGMVVADDTPTYTVTKLPAGVKPATAAQGALLARLIAERDPAMSVVTQAQTECAAGGMSAKRASTLIDALLKIAAVKAAHRPNRYDGTCAKCTGPVPAMTGRIEKNAAGRWLTFHLYVDDCMSDAAKAIADADKVTEPGLYRADTGDVYRVRHARGSKRLYGEKVVTVTHKHIDDDGIEGEVHHVSFHYNGNAMRFLRKSSKLTWAEARAFGKAYGACVACGRTLSDPRSLVQQYGSTCAGHYGWPTVTLKQAEAIIAGHVTWEEVTGAHAL